MKTSTQELSKADYERLRTLIYNESGINLGSEKKTMVEVRLRHRLRSLGMASLREYSAHVFSAKGKESELVHLIDVITTNKTDFFREASHFKYLVSTALPELATRHGVARKSLIWSAGCSTGEEPYTLGMVLSEYRLNSPGFRFSILATDICTEVLERAAAGIYRSDLLRPVPPELVRKYFMRSRDPKSEVLRVVPELRSLMDFRRLNFMDADFGLTEVPEIIFCRNVIIYFDRPTQIRLLEKLVQQLPPGGYFFSGHSESFQGMDLSLVQVAPAVYRKPG